MLDIPTHLLQALSVDTNITYDLDISKFPGLDDPQQMYQPALLIATDWSDYVYPDAQSVPNDTDNTTSSYDSDNAFVDDLYFLIETSQEFFTDVNSSDIMDDQIFQFLVDDVFADIDPASECLDDKLTLDDKVTIPKEHLSPFVSCIRGQKRRRNDDIESRSASKKPKLAEGPTLQFPTMVSVCSRSNVCELVRHS
ncbi:uncharacterized protein [Haliotis asinina]|uniref:uncharacterized protein n=1 Tax=Haliotis asinina TaxID=109174 RepID=UPI003532022B